MANDTAVRIIHFYFNRLGKKNKKKIIARTDGYHGSTYLAMSMTGVTFDHQGFDLAPDLVHHIPAPNTYRRPEGMTEDESWPLVDLRVDWSDEPIIALRELWVRYEPQMNDYLNRALNPEVAPSYGVPGDP